MVTLQQALSHLEDKLRQTVSRESIGNLIDITNLNEFKEEYRKFIADPSIDFEQNVKEGLQRRLLSYLEYKEPAISLKLAKINPSDTLSSNAVFSEGGAASQPNFTGLNRRAVMRINEQIQEYVERIRTLFSSTDFSGQNTAYEVILQEYQNRADAINNQEKVSQLDIQELKLIRDNFSEANKFLSNIARQQGIAGERSAGDSTLYTPFSSLASQISTVRSRPSGGSERLDATQQAVGLDSRASIVVKPKGPQVPSAPPPNTATVQPTTAVVTPPAALPVATSSTTPTKTPKPSTGKPAAPGLDIPPMVRNLNARMRKIEDVMPGLSEGNRAPLTKEIIKIQECIDGLKEISDELDKSTTPSQLLTKANGIYDKGMKQITPYRDYIPVKHEKAQKAVTDLKTNNKSGKQLQEAEHELAKWEKALAAYKIEKDKYEKKLIEINVDREALDKLEKSLDDLQKSKPPKPAPKPEVIQQTQQDIEALRLKIKLQREDAASVLVTLTKAYGGYPSIHSSINKVRMYRGGELGFETRVLSRSSAKELGFLKEKETGVVISSSPHSSYTVNARLTSTEVVVSTKTYAGDNQVVLVQEPGVVRDMSPEIKPGTMNQEQAEEMMNEKAIQMALMFAFNYKQGQPAIIRGGDPEVRKRAHAILLVLKHASDEGNVEMTMNYFLGKTLTRGAGWLQGKKIADIDLKGLQIHSNVGPQLYGSGNWAGADDNGRLFGRIKDRASRHIHSVDYMQKQRDMEFVKQVFPKLSTDEIFKKQKQEFLDIRNQGADKKAPTDSEVVLPSPKVPRK